MTSTILNLTISIFDDEKFVNSNELIAVEPIDDITIHMESPEHSNKDKLLVAIYINKSMSYIACNKIQPVNNEEEFVCHLQKLQNGYSSKYFSYKACFANDD